MTAYSVAQGRTIVLPVTWLAYEGGPAVTVTGVTIEILPTAGPPAVVGPTSVGVTTPAPGHNSYAWTVAVDQAPGDYLAVWRGLDPQGDEVTATDTITVHEHIPVPGAYATVQDLTEYLGHTPANAAQLLVRASRDVDRALLCAVYDPADPDVVQALREATCEQVAGYLDSGELTGTGAAPTMSGFTIGKLSVQHTPGAGGGQQASRVAGLWPQAWQVLQAAGLTGQGPQTC